MLAMECSKSTARRRAGQIVLEMLSGGYSGGDPPVPIPNTEVKPVSADGTWGVDPRESRTPPDTIVRAARDTGRPVSFWGTTIWQSGRRAGEWCRLQSPQTQIPRTYTEESITRGGVWRSGRR